MKSYEDAICACNFFSIFSFFAKQDEGAAESFFFAKSEDSINLNRYTYVSTLNDFTSYSYDEIWNKDRLFTELVTFLFQNDVHCKILVSKSRFTLKFYTTVDLLLPLFVK